MPSLVTSAIELHLKTANCFERAKPRSHIVLDAYETLTEAPAATLRHEHPQKAGLGEKGHATMRLVRRNRPSNSHGKTLRLAHAAKLKRRSRVRFEPREEPTAEIVCTAPVASLGSPVHSSQFIRASLKQPHSG